jgi:hypothetical protein
MRSDKMQMSAVPQTSEHVLISDNTVKDIVLPIGAIVEEIKVVCTVLEATASGAEIDLGTTTTANYYRATAVPCDNTGALGVVSPGVDAGPKMMSAVPADRIIRITPNSFSANSIARVYVWVNYRFASNDYPTQLV